MTIETELKNMDTALWRARAAAVRTSDHHIQIGHAIDAFGRLKSALSKQEQGEPDVLLKGIYEYGPLLEWYKPWMNFPLGTKFYTTPQQRKPLITEAMLDEFLEDYEMIGESEDGRDACYTPNENDKALIKDAIFGLLQFADDAAHGIKGNA